MRELPPGVRLLELGPGDGHVARLAQRRDLVWYGIERCLGCLGALRDPLSGGVIADVEALARLPGGYTAVLAADFLEHLADPDRLLRLARQALADEGRLLVSVPNVANVWVRLNLLFGRFPYTDCGILDRTHRVHYTRASLRRTLRDAGFVIERESVSSIPLRLALPRWPRGFVAICDALLRAATALFPGLLGYQLLGIGRVGKNETLGTPGGPSEGT